MPAIANITVKKNDNTTDIVWTGVSPSAGDGVPAIWRSQTVGNAASHQPELRLSAKDGSNGGKRVMRVTYVYPQISTNTTTGVTSVVDKMVFAGDWQLPKSMAAVDVNEAASQLANLVASALLKDCIKSGFSAT